MDCGMEELNGKLEQQWPCLNGTWNPKWTGTGKNGPSIIPLPLEKVRSNDLFKHWLSSAVSISLRVRFWC